MIQSPTAMIFSMVVFGLLILSSAGCEDEPNAAAGGDMKTAFDPGQPRATATGAQRHAPDKGESPSAASQPQTRGVGSDGTQAATSASETEDGERTVFVKLGRITLPLPAAWRPTESGKEPMHGLHLTPGPAMTCDIGLIDDHGRPEEAEKYLSGAAASYAGDVVRNKKLMLGGVELQGIHIEKPKALPGALGVDAYVGIIGSDLIALSLTTLAKPTQERRRCEDAFSKIARALRPLK